MNLIGKYQNGNYTVSIFDDGTKIRENDLDFFEAEFPESMDLKITNKCHNGCAFCHENSTRDGKHGDIMSPSFIDKLHPYTEIAIGGGNPLEHPDIVPFLEKLKSLKMIPSMTIRQNDFMDSLELITELVNKKLIYGLGISLVTTKQDGFIEAVQKFPNAVIHVINGIVTLDELEMLAYHNLKILILGYKEVRRGKDLFYSDLATQSWIMQLRKETYDMLPQIIDCRWFDVVSFDNLAIKQLNPQRLMSKEKWDEMYMGDDHADGKLTSASMYIDMVNKNFAANSCSPENERFELMDNIIDMYKFLCNRYNG